MRKIDAAKELFYAFADRSMAYNFQHVVGLTTFSSTVEVVGSCSELYERFKASLFYCFYNLHFTCARTLIFFRTWSIHFQKNSKNHLFLLYSVINDKKSDFSNFAHVLKKFAARTAEFICLLVPQRICKEYFTFFKISKTLFFFTDFY